MKIHWRNAREEYPKDYECVVCVLYREERTHNKWDLIIGEFNPNECFRSRHDDYIEKWQWARIMTGFDDWTSYREVKCWSRYSEFLKLIKKTIR